MSFNRDAANGGRKLLAVTPNDSTALSGGPCRALWVGTAGNVAVIADGDSSAVTLVNVSGLVPIEARLVMSTNTTASDIVAIY